jgi:hypothetical protein
MKIHPVGAELFHADGQTDRHDKANSWFVQFCKTHLKLQFMYKRDNNMQLEYYFIFYIFEVLWFFYHFCVMMCDAIVIRIGTVKVYLFTHNLMNCLKMFATKMLAWILEIARCIVVQTARVCYVYLADIHTVVLWLMTPCGLVGGCRCFWQTCCFHLHSFICTLWLLNVINCLLQ